MKLKKELVSKSQTTRLYEIPVPIIGLTGGIATGKSTVTKVLIEKGLSVICADQLVKSIYETSKSLEFVKKEFPNSISHNKIDFKLLRKEAFKDSKNKEKIENYIYSHLPEVFISEFSKLDGPSVLIYDVPLLFEKGLEKHIDISVCVYANRALQIKRLMKRDNVDEELALSIINNQMDIEKKKEMANFIIENEKGINDLKISIDKFLAETHL